MMLVVFAALAAFFFLCERMAPIDRRQRVLRSGFFVDASYVAIHYLMRLTINVALAGLVADLGSRLLPAHLNDIRDAQPPWVEGIVLLVVLDFVFYVTHRLKHRWQWWWRLHETHHSSTELDWLASVRFHPLEKMLDRTIYLLPLALIAPSNEAIVIWSTVDVFFGMFGHSNVSWRLGPLAYIFVGPEMHRWHHVSDPERRECNFGNNFSIFDWVFGTAYLSREAATGFGVPDPNYPTENIVKQWFYAFRPSGLKTTPTYGNLPVERTT